jgi:hypothetical protein
MIATSLHELLAFISEHLETDGASVVSHYHAWSEELFEKELKVRVEIQHYGIRPFYLKGHGDYLSEMKQLLDQHPLLQEFDRREQYARGHPSLHATDPTVRFEQAELEGQTQYSAFLKKIQKRGLTDPGLSQLSTAERYLLKRSLATGILVSLRASVTYASEDLLAKHDGQEDHLPINNLSSSLNKGSKPAKGLAREGLLSKLK